MTSSSGRLGGGGTEAAAGPQGPSRSFSIPRALTEAYVDTLAILTRPFKAIRWIKLSFLCLFLGGGTPSAALNWSWGTLLNDVGFRIALGRLRVYLYTHPVLIVLLIAVGLLFALGLLYVRALFRFILVEAILKPDEMGLAAAYKEIRPLGHSYLLWLLGAVTVCFGVLILVALGAMRYLRPAGTAGAGSLRLSLAVVVLSSVVALGGVTAAVTIMFTDDLVVPIMYAERLKLWPAWRRLVQSLRAEPAAFGVYALVRFGVSLLVGVVLLLLLFPLLLTLFSGFILIAVLTLIAARAVGFIWVWNPVTIVLASVALVLLTVVQLILLSVVAMPGQVFLQDFGMRFINSRISLPGLVWEDRSSF